MAGSPELDNRTIDERLDSFSENENTVFCSKCGQRYNANLKCCPNCGEKNRNKKGSPLKIIGIIAGVIVGLFIILGIIGNSIGANVQYIGDRSIQHDDAEEKFTLLFAFKDSNENRVASDAVVEIKIVNDNDETVYEGTKQITESDFGTWTSALQGERYLASIDIYDSEIEKGSSSSGKIYFTVYKDNVFSFDESVLEILYELPIDKPTISSDLPVTVGYSGYFGSDYVEIDDISFETYDYSDNVTINLSGKKVSGSNYCMFNYKIIDEDGYVVDSGTAYIDGLDAGDKFKDESIYASNIEAGKTYTIEFSNYSY